MPITTPAITETRASNTARWLRQAQPGRESRNSFAVAAAACELKLKRLTTAEAEALPDTPDENGARRLYLLMELARNRSDLDRQKRIVTEMESRFPQSPWLAEALFSSGNLYLLRRDYAQAAVYYSYPGHALPRQQKCLGGALEGGLAQLPAGALCRCGAPLRRADSALSQASTERRRRSIGAGASTRRRSTIRPAPRPTTAP
jgi:hypothetical protein